MVVDVVGGPLGWSEVERVVAGPVVPVVAPAAYAAVGAGREALCRAASRGTVVYRRRRQDGRVQQRGLREDEPELQRPEVNRHFGALRERPPRWRAFSVRTTGGHGR